MTSADRERDRIILDVLRGCAAIYVLAFHCIEYSATNGRQVAVKGGSAHLIVSQFGLGLLGYGHYAVLVFFVLSGYVIHLRQARRPDQRRSDKAWRWSGHYLWRRSARIYPPLLFAIFVTLIFDLIGWATYPGYYAYYIHAPKLSSALAILVPTHFDRFGSDAPLWSIQYELIFYVAYLALLLIVIDHLVSNVVALCVALPVVGLGLNFALQYSHHPLTLWTSALIYLPIWTSGMLLAELRCRGTVLKRPGLVAAVGTMVLVFCGAISDNKTHVKLDYLWGLGIVLMMAVIMLRPAGIAKPNAVLRRISRSSEWSYSVYLVHFPLIFFARRFWLGHLLFVPSPIVILFIFTLGLLLGIATWWIVERPSRWLVAHPPRIILGSGSAPVELARVASD